MNKYRIHLLGLPNAPTTKAYSLDGFAMATMRFAKLLKLLGHHVTLYGAEGNEAPCDEFVSIISERDRIHLLGNDQYQYAAMNGNYPLWALANPRMIEEIAKRKQPRDFICTIGGTSQQVVCDAHPDLLSVEYSIGYVSSFSKYRVYESHAWRHATHGFQNDWQGRFFDAVIPLFFDKNEFTFRKDKEPFALYVGRLTARKGLVIACQSAQAAGVPLKIIGHGDTNLVTHGAEFIGTLSMEERNDYMSRAQCLICPTQYIEPFGSIAVEAQMCGTPVIATNFGGFTETVENGKTGYLENYLGGFANAIHNSKHLDHEYIRNRAIAKYSIESLSEDYQKYFDLLNMLWADGWNTVDASLKKNILPEPPGRIDLVSPI